MAHSPIHEIPYGTFELKPQGSYKRVITRSQAVKIIAEEDTCMFPCDIMEYAIEPTGFLLNNGDILFYSVD